MLWYPALLLSSDDTGSSSDESNGEKEGSSPKNVDVKVVLNLLEWCWLQIEKFTPLALHTLTIQYWFFFTKQCLITHHYQLIVVGVGKCTMAPAAWGNLTYAADSVLSLQYTSTKLES